MKDKRYLNCKYLDAGMDGMLCSMSLCTTCKEFNGEKCSYYTPKNKMKDKGKQFKERVECGIAYCEDTAVDEIKQDLKMHEEKHKQIEEMANTCKNYRSCALCPYNPEDISRFIGERWKGGCPDYDRKIVYSMGKGYRKILENEVVLTREEYERLKRVENEKDRLYEIKLDLENQLIEKGWTDYEGADEIEKRVSKETAEKIKNGLRSRLVYDDKQITIKDKYIIGETDIEEVIKEHL